MNAIRIGTRGSALALAQTKWVKGSLEERYPDLRVEVITIKTSGDRFLSSPIKAIGKGIFVKEIEEALLGNEIDLAVHSLKDLPTDTTPGLTIAAVPEREDPRDVWVSQSHIKLADLPAGATVGTGSLRRCAQLLHYRPSLSVRPIRGNVDTRLKKMDRGEVDGLVMAAAGLNRLGLEDRISEHISADVCMSAPAQGALGLQSRADDHAIGLVSFLRHAPTMLEVTAERAFLKRLGGGCQLPVGALGSVEGRVLTLRGVVAAPDGSKLYNDEHAGPAEEADRLGTALAERLLTLGADKILDSDTKA